jgi:hypothetical protein
MTKSEEPGNGRSKLVKLSAEESLKRVQALDERKEAFIAAIRRAFA